MSAPDRTEAKGPSCVPEAQCEAHYPYASPGCPTCGDAPVMLRGHDWTEADEKALWMSNTTKPYQSSVFRPRKQGKTAEDERQVAEQVAAGLHVHTVSPRGQVCANGICDPATLHARKGARDE